jgi:hypothetical protein
MPNEHESFVQDYYLTNDPLRFVEYLLSTGQTRGPRGHQGHERSASCLGSFCSDKCQLLLRGERRAGAKKSGSKTEGDERAIPEPAKLFSQLRVYVGPKKIATKNTVLNPDFLYRLVCN